jgi:molybdate transport system substrate-binding protein
MTRVAVAMMFMVQAALLTVASPVQEGPVLVFAAASLKTVLDALVEPAHRATAMTVRVSYAATSALARQIEEGAPADLFISADVEWMDYVEARGLLGPDTRVDLLTNRLVLVAPRSEPVTLAIAPGFALAEALGGRGRLAVADPSVVPAGKYARAALTSLGVWSSVSARLAPAENVRAALLLVSRAEAPLGIVYRTDALADPDVTIVDTFPEPTHPPIVYPAALTARASTGAVRVLGFLRSATARAEFERQGFAMAHEGGRQP